MTARYIEVVCTNMSCIERDVRTLWRRVSVYRERSLFLARRDVELEEDDIPVEHRIPLALLPVLASRLHRRFAAQLLELIKVHHLGADESSLEIRVNRTGGLRCLGPLSNLPALDLIRASCHELDQVHRLEPGLNDLRERTRHLVLLAVDLPLVLRHVRQRLLQRPRKGNHRTPGRMLLNPGMHLGQPLVLLPLVVLLRQVDQVHHRLGRDELHHVQPLNLLDRPIVIMPDILPGLQPLQHHLARLHMILVLALVRRLPRLRQTLLLRTAPLQVLQTKLVVNNLQILHRVHAVLDVHHVRVLKRPHHMEDAIHRLNVAQERVPQPLTVCGALDQPGDIRHLQERRHRRLGLVHVHEPIEAVVRDVDPGRVGVDRAERKVLRRDRAARDGIEERRLAHIRESNDANLQVGLESTQYGLGCGLFLLLRRHDDDDSRLLL
mmetsp:Transcript_106/g.273  ORF Transcript_106/g.273 Transcript_106/m.273 type:complete len:437 (+) Transcript_106:1044-2354(+)